MAKVTEMQCLAEDAYNFNLNKRALIGHITTMKFTNIGKEIKPEFKVADPESPLSKKSIVGVVEYLYWDGDDTHPLKIEGRITPEGRNIMNEADSSKASGAEAEFTFIMYEYDDTAKKYCQCWHCDGVAIKVQKTNNTKIDVATTADPVIQEPSNYRFSASFTPKSGAGAQSLHFCHGVNNKFARDFGVEVSA